MKITTTLAQHRLAVSVTFRDAAVTPACVASAFAWNDAARTRGVTTATATGNGTSYKRGTAQVLIPDSNPPV